MRIIIEIEETVYPKSKIQLEELKDSLLCACSINELEPISIIFEEG